MRPVPMRLYYGPAYVMAATGFDTTRKAAWVAESLRERPIAGVELIEPAALTEDELMAVHEPGYVRAVRTGEPADLAASNGIGWDPDLFPAVAASNGGAVAAALEALASGGVAGSLSSGLHHAQAGSGAGFCTFNGLALAARAAQRAGASRILILDLDAHCGGGTHELLGADPGILQLDVAVSSYDRYEPTPPWTLDLVVDADDYLTTIVRRLDALETSAERFDLVIYNAGMDPFEGSRVGGLAGDRPRRAGHARAHGLRARTVERMARRVRAGGRIRAERGRAPRPRRPAPRDDPGGGRLKRGRARHG